jgi:hypothetical protein
MVPWSEPGFWLSVYRTTRARTLPIMLLNFAGENKDKIMNYGGGSQMRKIYFCITALWRWANLQTCKITKRTSSDYIYDDDISADTGIILPVKDC